MKSEQQSFEVETIGKDYSIKKTILDNSNYYRYTISDDGHEEKHYFKCSECQENSTKLGWPHVNRCYFDKDEITVIRCLNCQARFCIQTGYAEPNNGRDVYFISYILLIE